MLFLVDHFEFKVHQDAHFRISFYFIFRKTVGWKRILRKSYAPFHWHSQEKQFLKGFLVGKSHCIMIRDEFRIRSNIDDGTKSRYLFCQKARSCLTGF